MWHRIIISIFWLFLFSCTNNRDEQTTSVHQHGNIKSGYADSVNNGLVVDTMKKSVPRTAMANFGKNHVHIEYSSPGVRNRVIWGGVVPMNEVWVAGAHHATRITFSKNVVINQKQIPAGTYALFCIPNEVEWTVILNKNYDQHLTDDYDADLDVIRTAVQPMPVPLVQRLTYEVIPSSDSNGIVSMSWEKLRWRLPISNAK